MAPAAVASTSPGSIAIVPSSSMPVQHKMLYQSLMSLASPVRPEDGLPQLIVNDERVVIFHERSLGIQISRHTDGYVRVLSVASSSSSPTDTNAMTSSPSSSSVRQSFPPTVANAREGEIRPGDVVREVGGVNLRMPIDAGVWKLTIGLVRMAPRPLTFVVAGEASNASPKSSGETSSTTTTTTTTDRDSPSSTTNAPNGDDDDDDDDMPWRGRARSRMQPARAWNAPAAMPPDDGYLARNFGPNARVVTFHESSLGIQLRRDGHGRAIVVDVVVPPPPQRRSSLASSFFGGGGGTSSTPSVSGDIRAGDVVLDVNDGAWDLRDRPLFDIDEWRELIEYVRDGTSRPLRMVVVSSTFAEERGGGAEG